MKRAMLVLAGVGLSQAAWAQAASWTGAEDDRWENAANWAPAVVPDRGTTVVIPAAQGPARGPVICRTAVVRRLILEEGATLSIEGERTLYVVDTLEVAGALRIGVGRVEVDGRLEMRRGGRIEQGEGAGEHARANVSVWTGAVSTNWNDTDNWSTWTVPSSSSWVVIPSTETGRAPVVQEGSYQVGAIQVDGGALTVSGTASLGVGSLAVSSGQAAFETTGAVHVGSITASGGTLAWAESTTLNLSGNLTAEPGTVTTTGTIVLSGGTTQILSGASLTDLRIASGTAVAWVSLTSPVTAFRSETAIYGGTWSFVPDPEPAAGPSTRTWVGPDDGAWNDPAMWSPAGVPGPEDTVVLQSDPVLTSEATIRKLVVKQGGVLILRGGRLRVTENAELGGRVAYEEGGALEVDGLIVAHGAAELTR